MTNQHTSTQERSDRQRWIALYVLCVGMLMIVLDVTIVNVALPSIQDDLDFSQSSLAWVVNAYLIAFGGLLLLAGRLGDLIGRKRVFLAGLAVFSAASLLCGAAQSQEMLVAARFVQGIGGAMTSAVILGMIVTMFPEPREQAKAIGVYAFVASAGGSVGLLAGGVLTQAINWHWIFFVNLPIGIATAIYAKRLLDRDEGIGFGEGADVPGAVLVTSALMLAVYTIVKPAAEDGWGASTTLLLGAVAVAAAIAFGFGGRDIAHRQLERWAQRLEVGQASGRGGGAPSATPAGTVPPPAPGTAPARLPDRSASEPGNPPIA
jgi:MFS family permease